MTAFTTQLTWKGLIIELTYHAQWSKAAPDIVHLEIKTIQPAGSPIPITKTGYRSHFYPCQREVTTEELKDIVLNWLDQESRSAEWQAHQQNTQQLTLF